MMDKVILAGFGGQGVMFLGKLLAYAGMGSDLELCWIPSYGPEMRGGTANCTVKFGEGRIYNPSLDQPDIVLAMNISAFKQFIPLVKSGGTIVINSDMVDASLNTRDDIKIIEVPCMTMAQEIGHAKGANIIMAGVIVKESEYFSEEEALNGMNDMFRKKGKEKFEESNTKALKLGYSFQ